MKHFLTTSSDLCQLFVSKSHKVHDRPQQLFLYNNCSPDVPSHWKAIIFKKKLEKKRRLEDIEEEKASASQYRG